jgi:hypothetical protein
MSRKIGVALLFVAILGLCYLIVGYSAVRKHHQDELLTMATWDDMVYLDMIAQDHYARLGRWPRCWGDLRKQLDQAAEGSGIDLNTQDWVPKDWWGTSMLHEVLDSGRSVVYRFHSLGPDCVPSADDILYDGPKIRVVEEMLHWEKSGGPRPSVLMAPSKEPDETGSEYQEEAGQACFSERVRWGVKP